MIRKYGGQRHGDRQGTHFFMILSNLFSYFLTLSHTLNRPSVGNLFRFVFKISDFLGRLQPAKTTIQKTRGTLRVEESSSPRQALHSYSNSSRGRTRAELWRFKVSGQGYPCDLVSRLDFRRFSSAILVFKELLQTVLGDL